MNFLRDIAKDLLQRHGNNLSDVTMVFPGKRASLFMNQYLAEESDSPVWAPRYTTIDELVQKLSPYRKADSITSVCTLYNIYAELVPDAESLDDFYAWGEIILSDFDDIDKHRAPADKIFQNAYDLHNITEDYLTDEQVAALQKFFKNFSKDDTSKLKERFLRLWQIMPELYQRLKEELKKQGLLYSGAQYRDVAERMKQPPQPPRGSNETGEQLASLRTTNSTSRIGGAIPLGIGGTICFAGFNILDECTEDIFNYFKQEGNTLFYWDYDRFYMDDKMCEAGYFMHNNLKLFPNALPAELFDNLRNIKEITYIATSTDNAQCRYIPEWLSKNLTARENETAIILADEHQLGNVLHSIPEDSPKYINVTMGFPLTDTPVFSFINELLALYIDGYDTTTGKYRYTISEKVKRHPYYAFVDESIFEPEPYEASSLLTRLISIVDRISQHYAKKEKQDVYDQLYIEALFKTHLTLTKFLQLISPTSLTIKEVGASTLRRLLRQVLSSTSIPFHGEPAIGMQVMGLLEARNIDFRNLLMLNVGEGILPKKNDDNSLIPYNLREAFGLTTMRHRVSVFAYYFFRLISRTERLTLMYNENASGIAANEMSRFLRQLMAETDLPIKFVRLMPSNDRYIGQQPTSIAKTDEMIEKLKERYINSPGCHISPTAINTLLDCSLKFYFTYVAGLRIEDNPEEGITPSLFGNIFHDSADMFYQHLTHHSGSKTITKEMLTSILENKERLLYPFVDCSLILNFFEPTEDQNLKEERLKSFINMDIKDVRAYVKDFYDKPSHAMLLSGLNHIVRNVLIQYLTALVKYDACHSPFTLVGLEEDYYFHLELEPGQEIQTGGRIDRLEMDKDGILTVVDYKTGGRPGPVSNIETIFKHKDRHAGYFLQTFIYALAANQKHPDKLCRPTLFYVNHCNQPETYERTMRLGTDAKSEPVLQINGYAEEFQERLREALRNLFSKEYAFEPTDNDKVCTYCNFKQICNK